MAAMPRCIPACALALLAACGPDLPKDLGDPPEDRVLLAGHPVLGHLAAALGEDGADLTLEELLRTERPAFASAPDPSALFAARRAEHAALPPLADAAPLRVLTYNTALLGRWYPFVSVLMPELEARRPALAPLVLDDRWDIVFFQEVWDLHDVALVRQAAAARGYLMYAGSDHHHEEHGLVTLIRQELVDPEAPQDQLEVRYEQQRDIELFPGPGVARGYLRWSFTHAESGRRIHLFNTHTTAFPSYARVRSLQARQMGLAIRALPEDDLVLAGGDMNSAPYYPEDVFGEEDGEPNTGWWENAVAYPLWLHYGGLEDARNAATTPTDVEDMRALPAWSPAYFDAPLGGDAFCERAPRPHLTATDCNSLYFRSYAGTEYSARIDFIFFRDRARRLRVDAVDLAYAAPIEWDDGRSFELSDHIGVAATMRLALD